MYLDNIPDDWSPEQALAVYEFLSDLQHSLWDRYELQLIDLLHPDPDQTNDEQLDLFELNDSDPF